MSTPFFNLSQRSPDGARNNERRLIMEPTQAKDGVVRHTVQGVVEFLCEVVAWTLYGLSRVHLAKKPWYTSCIAEFTTCGYCMDNNGFPRFPLWSLARKFDAEFESRKFNPTGQPPARLGAGSVAPGCSRSK